jgi:hypothetical protein
MYLDTVRLCVDPLLHEKITKHDKQANNIPKVAWWVAAIEYTQSGSGRFLAYIPPR